MIRNGLAWWTPRKRGLLHYKRTLVDVIDWDKRGGLPCLNLLVRSDMVQASDVIVDCNLERLRSS